jgi:hypothetical protein
MYVLTYKAIHLYLFAIAFYRKIVVCSKHVKDKTKASLRSDTERSLRATCEAKAKDIDPDSVSSSRCDNCTFVRFLVLISREKSGYRRSMLPAIFQSFRCNSEREKIFKTWKVRLCVFEAMNFHLSAFRSVHRMNVGVIPQVAHTTSWQPGKTGTFLIHNREGKHEN